MEIPALYVRWLNDENSDKKEAVKIFLADETTTPFYLKKVKNQLFNKELLEREQKRTEFLYNRDNSKNTKSKDMKRKNLQNSISPRIAIISPRDKEIEDTLFGPYRNSDTAYSRLLQKVQAYKSTSLKIAKNLNGINSYKHYPSMEERLERVSMRKKELEIEKEQLHLELVEKIKKDAEIGGKVNKLMLIKSYKTIKRTEQLLTVMRIFSFIAHTRTKINKLRTLKETNKEQWKAALLIQRYYFKFYDERHKKFKKNKRSTLAMKNEMALQKLREIKNRLDAKEIYAARVNACTVLTNWMTHLSKTFVSAIRGYVIKIKAIQRHIKKHLNKR